MHEKVLRRRLYGHAALPGNFTLYSMPECAMPHASATIALRHGTSSFRVDGTITRRFIDMRFSRREDITGWLQRRMHAFDFYTHDVDAAA